MNLPVAPSSVILIPVFRPQPNLIHFCKELIQSRFSHIVVINDGNPSKDHHYFTLLQSLGIIVLHHSVNQGKGAAIKTGLRYLISLPQSIEAVITVDADGQHLLSDVIKIQEAMVIHPKTLILGSRQWKDATIPWRSRMGNQITRLIFKLLSGLSLMDTQTGLRGIPYSLFYELVKIPYQRYEFEMVMLLQLAQKKYPIKEVPITTVYHQPFAVSSFNPVLDSIRIYGAILKQPFLFFIVAGTSFLLDILLFYFFNVSNLFNGLFPLASATLLARLLSGIYNYTMNRFMTFSSNTTFRRSFPLYVLLFFSILMVSALSVEWLGFVLPIEPWIIKIAVDFILFFVSFFVQKRWVFHYEN